MEIAWISSGASLMEVQKSQSVLTLSASWTAMLSTAIPLATVDKGSAIVGTQPLFTSLQFQGGFIGQEYKCICFTRKWRRWGELECLQTSIQAGFKRLAPSGNINGIIDSHGRSLSARMHSARLHTLVHCMTRLVALATCHR